MGDLGSVPWLGRSPGEGKSYLLQYSCLKNSMDRGAWLVGYSPRGHKESDMTEWLNFSLSFTLKIPSIDTPWTDNRHSTTCQAQVLIFVHNNYYSPFKEIDIKAQRDFIIWPSLWVNKCMSWGADTITSKPESDTQKEELPGAVLSWLPFPEKSDFR